MSKRQYAFFLIVGLLLAFSIPRAQAQVHPLPPAEVPLATDVELTA